METLRSFVANGLNHQMLFDTLFVQCLFHDFQYGQRDIRVKETINAYNVGAYRYNGRLASQEVSTELTVVRKDGEREGGRSVQAFMARLRTNTTKTQKPWKS